MLTSKVKLILLTLNVVCLAASQEVEEMTDYFDDFMETSDVMSSNPSMQETRSGPSYLMSAYSETINKVPEINFTSYQLTPQELAEIDKSDTVASFSAKMPRTGYSKKTTLAVMFDIEVMKEEQRLMKAELRLFRDKSRVMDQFQGCKFNLTVYRVTPSGTRKKYVYATSKMVDADFKGWIVLDVTESFQVWKESDGSRDGFRILGRVEMEDSNKSTLVSPDFLGVVGIDGDSDKLPFALGYYQGLFDMFENLVGVVSDAKKRLFREANFHDFDYEEVHDDFKSLNPLSKRIYQWKRFGLCDLRKIIVEFKDIGIDKIVIPAGFEVNDCLGRCRYPFASRANATDHAIFKMKASEYEITRLNKPGCTPIKFQDLTYLYDAGKSALIKSKFKNMSASECGCR